ncbi:Cyclopropane-fatty-acyl-phospholipid synthase [Candidatus Phaeomarinobacter ectocarpi]|uniref:Cyclopropane-fatty-acyl-phospholipid synthase n=1 Tax=Candidatus Phaeomarinibacter ectocarpi TaxID=1458461 RepID=X5MN03_9HYPH|nr:cyclopropane-fatty-acyl-phospholipid synthase family protein [Candidatus Phaeomarinobacter ectocarpi]CDO60865.1 Cyclopropane-fatty-acyl-phospholipid synthase [Candidatus Phaeomarinobacter ectocarpi]
MFLRWMLQYVVKTGDLTVHEANGRLWTAGDGSEPRVTLHLRDRSIGRAIAFNPHLKFGEGYMEGRFHITEGDIWDLMDLLGRNVGTGYGTPLAALIAGIRRFYRRILQYNPVGRARANVAHHYDLDGRLYDLFLDPDRQYSCAYFEDPLASLDDAQLAKKRHIAAKLALAPGHTVLDIGSGWGGLGLYLAQMADVDVTGVTLSQEQYTVSNARADALDRKDRVRFKLQDYRELDSCFDRIVSVGMFEHVGVGHYGEYFRQVARLLDEDGVALVHSIGRIDGPGTTNPWIAKYIFPGGYIPALSEVLPSIERAGLFVTDVEILRLHYADTLRHWRERFAANRGRAAEVYDERFCRMWEFYLAASEASFRHMGFMVFQIQLTKKVGTVPLTRSYIAKAEEGFRDREGTTQAGPHRQMHV